MLEDDFKQRLSLLIDDRFDTAAAIKLLKTIEADRKLSATYSRYLMIGDVVRNRGNVIHDARFVDRIHEAIVNEPPIVAPLWKRVARDRAVTLAMAATLAGLAVLVGESVVRQHHDLSIPGFERQARMSETAEAVGNVDTYLINHNGTAYLAANGGLLPYLRVVSHGTSNHR